MLLHHECIVNNKLCKSTFVIQHYQESLGEYSTQGKNCKKHRY